MRLLLSGLLAVAMLAVSAPVARAARADRIGDAQNTVIVWDGSRDVPVSAGIGDTSTIASLGLADFADLAIIVTASPATPAIRVNVVRLLLRSNSMAARCAVPSPPTACAWVRPLGQVLSYQSLQNLNPTGGNTREFLATLPTIGLELVPAELPGLWRLAPPQQAALTEIVQAFGAQNIRMGIDSEIGKDLIFNPSRRVVLEDMNLPVGSTAVAISAVAPASGPVTGGTPITITGRNFVSGAIVTVDGGAATAVRVLNSSTIFATTPLHTSGVVNVAVRNPDATTATLPNAFTYQAFLSNDNFAGRLPIAGFGVRTATAFIDGATSEAGEPSDLIGAGSGTASLWWTWRASCSFEVASPASFIDTIGSTPDTVVGVFTGNSLGTLTRLASDDDSGGSFASRIPSTAPGPSSLLITAGTVLQIRVRGFGAAAGIVSLHVNSPCAPPPAVDAIRPAASAGLPGTTMTVTGTNFLPGVLVSLEGEAKQTLFLNSTTLLVRVGRELAPESLMGLVDVTVTNPDGQSATVVDGFTYLELPATVSSVVPASGSTEGGTPILIRGEDFTIGASVEVGGVAATNVVVLDERTISATTPLHSAGVADISVRNPGSRTVILANGFAFVPLPLNDAFANRRSIGGYRALAATGSNAGATAEPGEPGDPFGAATSSVWWTWTASCSFSVSAPDSFVDTIGSTFDTVLTLFTGSSLATLSPVATDNDSGGSLTSRLPSATPGPSTLNISAGTVLQIRVRGVLSSTGTIVLHVNSPCLPPPAIESVTPSIVSTFGGASVTVKGDNFFTGAIVRIDGSPASAFILNPSTLLVTANAHGAGPVSLSVTNPDGQTTTLPSALNYRGSAPVLNAVTPLVGPTAGGTTITLQGANFVPGAAVLVGGIPAANVSVPNQSVLTATTPLHSAGKFDVKVTNPDGQSAVLIAGFAYVGPPATVSAIMPNSGPAAGGTPVIITGTNFAVGASVAFGGVSATNVRVLSSTTITATTSCGTPGTCPNPDGPVSVVVSNPGTPVATLPNGFRYFNRRSNDDFADRIAISGMGTFTAVGSLKDATAEVGEPSDGIEGGGVTPSLWWTWTAPCSFTVTSPDVLFEARSPDVVDPVLAVFTGNTLGTLALVASNDDAGPALSDKYSQVPSLSPGPAALNVTAGTVFQIRVRTWNGFSSSRVELHINNPCPAQSAPVVTTVSPPSGPIAGGTPVTVTGSNFLPGAALSLGGVPATNVTVVNSTTIHATTGAHGAKPVDVTVSSVDGQVGTRVNGFTYLDVAPSVVGIAPAGGVVGGGTVVTILGSGFAVGATVSLGDVPATNVTVLDANTIRAVTGSHAAATVNVSVMNPDTQVGVLGNGFTYGTTAPPFVTSDPTSVALTPGRDATFTASAMAVPAATVQWQVSADGSVWANIAGANAPSYATQVGLNNNGLHFRAVFTNSAGSAITGAARLFVRSRVSVPTDLDGDGLGDLVIWRPGNGTWFWLESTTAFDYAGAGAQQWGNNSLGDRPLMGDIDGDGKGDLAVWRANTGTWFWLTSSSGYNPASSGFKQWGNSSLGDVPMLTDMDGDGRADLVVWRASTGTWYWLTSSSGYDFASASGVQWGNQAAGDTPVIGDFDGDGKADPAVWRASTGTWFWLSSAIGYGMGGAKDWGNAGLGDTPLVGDLDGDGRAELTLWRASTGTWFWLSSSTGYSYGAAGSKQWGSQAFGDQPRLADVDGDGRDDLIVWRPPTGTWHLLPSIAGYGYEANRAKQWGSLHNADVPMIR